MRAHRRISPDSAGNAGRHRWGRALVQLGIGAFGLVLSGCISAPQPTAETGPFPTRYREMAKEYLRRPLFDPYSVLDAEIAEPAMKASIYLLDPAPAWTICVRLNAKNRMGAYTGISEDALLVRGDRVTISLNELTKPSPTIGMCRDAKWAPFPELGS